MLLPANVVVALVLLLLSGGWTWFNFYAPVNVRLDTKLIHGADALIALTAAMMLATYSQGDTIVFRVGAIFIGVRACYLVAVELTPTFLKDKVESSLKLSICFLVVCLETTLAFKLAQLSLSNPLGKLGLFYQGYNMIGMAIVAIFMSLGACMAYGEWYYHRHVSDEEQLADR